MQLFTCALNRHFLYSTSEQTKQRHLSMMTVSISYVALIFIQFLYGATFDLPMFIQLIKKKVEYFY